MKHPCPDFKGIETLTFPINNLPILRNTPALISKGLRQDRPHKLSPQI